MNAGAQGFPPLNKSKAPRCKVADLGAGEAGDMKYATDCRVFDGAGSQESSGAGTGSLVIHNGSAWKIAGTNVTAIS